MYVGWNIGIGAPTVEGAVFKKGILRGAKAPDNLSGILTTISATYILTSPLGPNIYEFGIAGVPILCLYILGLFIKRRYKSPLKSENTLQTVQYKHTDNIYMHLQIMYMYLQIYTWYNTWNKLQQTLLIFALSYKGTSSIRTPLVGDDVHFWLQPWTKSWLWCIKSCIVEQIVDAICFYHSAEWASPCDVFHVKACEVLWEGFMVD